MIVKSHGDQPDSDLADEPKIFYCSRTHSQLTQFVGELRRVKIPSFTVGDESTVEGPLQEEVKHLPLGSRKNLCINPRVTKLGSALAINEKCLELQQSGGSQEHKCSFLPHKDNGPLVSEFIDKTLARIRDIEDLAELGKRIGICPYYASRATIKASEASCSCTISSEVAVLTCAQIVTLPYPLLLQENSRKTLDISLKGHVVIIDEAHNLIDAISNIYSTSILCSQLKRSRSQLGLYLQKFRNKLKGKNRVYVTQVVRLIDSIAACLIAKANQSTVPDGLLQINDLMAGKGVDQINLYKLMRYLQDSKLARKVDAYASRAERGNQGDSNSYVSTTPVLSHVHSFLHALTNPSTEGRFFFSRIDGNDVSLEYMLLDSSYHFRNIVDEARAVILIGGTMSPVSPSTTSILYGC